MKDESVITIKDMWWKYEEGQEWALNDINLDVKKGEFLAIMGSNGAGKSTLCCCLNGLIPHSFSGTMRGKVFSAGMDTQQHKVSEIAERVGMVFQDPESQFILTAVADEVSFGPENLGLSVKEIGERLEWALRIVRMEWAREKPPRELSGGEKQRVAIAAALALRPEILILDEPTSQLDPLGKREVLTTLDELRKEFECTIIVATHEAENVVKFADRIILLNEGKKELEGTPEEFLKKVDYLIERGVYPPQVTEFSYLVHRDLLKDNIQTALPVNIDQCYDELCGILNHAQNRTHKMGVRTSVR
ncbi:MAG TPA: ATP-binding cassette domain-containing protein [Candidatus Bathyarchaeia archaeon]|nr:ATP-binding cassette domain-containing protein [Candidatus Bathyarchaeia archaeon]